MVGEGRFTRWRLNPGYGEGGGGLLVWVPGLATTIPVPLP